MRPDIARAHYRRNGDVARGGLRLTGQGPAARMASAVAVAGGAMTSHESEIETLRAKHRELDEALAEENRRPYPDSVRIGDLKRRKLRLKDDIAQLSRD